MNSSRHLSLPTCFEGEGLAIHILDSIHICIFNIFSLHLSSLFFICLLVRITCTGSFTALSCLTFIICFGFLVFWRERPLFYSLVIPFTSSVAHTVVAFSAQLPAYGGSAAVTHPTPILWTQFQIPYELICVYLLFTAVSIFCA